MRRIFVFVAALSLLSIPALASANQPTLPDAEAVSAAVLVEPETCTRLWANRADERYIVAGLSKLPALLTLAQAFDDGAIDASTAMRVSSHASEIAGPTAFLEANEEIDAGTLMKAAVMISAGDAIMTLGENVYGSESVFVDNINVTLRQLGLTASLSDAMGSAAGLTAWDLALLGRAAAESDTFLQYSRMYYDGIQHSDGRETELVSANRLLKSYAGCIGLQTGSSAEVGYGGVFLIERNGMRLIAVVLGAKNASERAGAACALLDYGFATYRTQTLAAIGKPVEKNIPVRNGNVKVIDLVVREDVTIIAQTAGGELTQSLDLPEILEAPLDASVSVGTVTFTNASGEVVASVPVYPSVPVEAFGITDLLRRIIAAFLA